MDIATTLRAARLQRGLNQHAVASLADVTQAHVSMVERGHNATLAVVERIADALGLQIAIEPKSMAAYNASPYGEDEVANRIYAMARLAAQRVTPQSLDVFRESIESLRAYHGDYPYYREWLTACANGADAVVTLLTDPTERGRYLRSVVSLRAFISQEERDAYFRQAQPA